MFVRLALIFCKLDVTVIKLKRRKSSAWASCRPEITEVSNAYRYFSPEDCVGNIVFSPEDPSARTPAAPPLCPSRFVPDKVNLFTGCYGWEEGMESGLQSERLKYGPRCPPLCVPGYLVRHSKLAAAHRWSQDGRCNGSGGMQRRIRDNGHGGRRGPRKGPFHTHSHHGIAPGR